MGRDIVSVVTMIGELWESGEKRSEACTHIMDTFSDYVDNISSFDAQGRYLQGKLIFDIAGLFVGITEIKAFIKTGQLTSSTLQGLQKLAKGGKKLVWALGKKIEVDKNKVVTYLLAANMKLEIAKFGDDGVLIIDDLIRDNTAVVLENIGEVPFRRFVGAPEEVAELGIVQVGDKVGLGVLNKVADAVDDLLDAVYNTQKGIISKYKGSISNASRNAKGVFGEVATDVKFTENGFEALHIRKGQNGDLLDGWGETGLDHVFKKDGKYYIVDSKYGTAKLNKNTIDGPQMGDDWIKGSDRLNNAVGEGLAEEILDSDYIRIVSRRKRNFERVG